MQENYVKILPRKYLDLKNCTLSLNGLFPLDDGCFYGKIKNISISYGSKQNKTKSQTKFDLYFPDGTFIKTSFFGPPIIYADLIKDGFKVLVIGSVKEFNGKLYLNGKNIFPNDFYGKILPIYPNIKRKSIDSKEVYLYNQTQGHKKSSDFSDEIISYFLSIKAEANEKYILKIINSSFNSIKDIIYEIHAPESMYSASKALNDIKKISALKVILDGEKISKLLPVGSQYAIPYSLEVLKELSDSMPIKLTNEQKRAALSILDKISKPVMTSSLISGDVGTGKTAVIALIAASVLKYDHDVAIMVPNTVLPKQFYDEFKRFWGDIPVVVVDDKFKKKNDFPTIYIGTTRLISKFKNHQFGLIVVDEQHRFSFEQRKKLQGLNYVEATATCIPHTMGLINYSGFHIARLTKCYTEKNITTTINTKEQKKEIIQKLRNIIENNQKAIIIYPMAEKKEDSKSFKDDRSAEFAFEMFESIFPGRCECVHGRLKSDEKIEAVARLKRNEKQILISTTVVEVGVDIKDVRLMVIASPDNLGLSQLHQLRGRLARNGGDAECILYLEKQDNEDILKRLNAFCNISDGFQLAEADLELRGMGNIDGSNQKGKTDTFLINYYADLSVLNEINSLINCNITDR